MALIRTNITRGPCKVYYDSTTFFSSDVPAVDLDSGLVDVPDAIFGPKFDNRVENPKATVAFTPHLFSTTGPATPAFTAVCASLVPAIFTNGYYGTSYIGSGSEKPVTVWGLNGEQFLISNAIITKPPTITFAADKPLFGPVQMVGIVKATGGDLVLGVNAIYNESTGAADPGLAAVGTPTYLYKRYKAVLGTQTGMTEMWAEEGWTVEFMPSWLERKCQGLTIDYELTGMEIMVRGRPLQLGVMDTAALLAVGGDGGASYVQGYSGLNTNTTHDLTIVDPSGPTTVFSLRKPILRTAGFRWGYEELRVGELGFHSTVRLSAGAAQPLAAFAAFA